jgi:ketosteroid isomerase-like protein
MSRENVSVLEQNTQAFNRRDRDAIQKLWHPEGEFISAVADIEGAGGVYGAGEVSRYMDDLDDLFEAWRIEEASYIEADDACVVQVQRVTGRAKGSGAPINQRVGIVWTFRDGLIFRGRVFVMPQDALDAAGLSEQDVDAADS